MKVLLADDHWIVRTALCRILEQLDEDIEVLEAGTFDEAFEIAKSTADLDLILVDLVMPGMNRLVGMQTIHDCRPQVPVVVISVIEDRKEILRAVDLGAMGYVPKTAEGDDIIKALKLVLNGGVALPRRILQRRDEFAMDDAIKEPLPELIDSRLTKRQHQVLELLGEGGSNAQIADKLGLSKNTVRVHIHAILNRLQLKNRTEAALLAASKRRQNDGNGQSGPTP